MNTDVPLVMFILINLIAFSALYFSFKDYEVWNIVCSLCSMVLFFWLSKVVINETFVQTFGDVTGDNIIITQNAVITNASLGYFYLMMAIIMSGVMIMNIYYEYEVRTLNALEDY